MTLTHKMTKRTVGSGVQSTAHHLLIGRHWKSASGYPQRSNLQQKGKSEVIRRPPKVASVLLPIL